MDLQMKIRESFLRTKSRLSVDMDDYQSGSGLLSTEGIGSCLVIAFYSPERRIGTLAHISGIRCLKTVPKAVWPEKITETLWAELAAGLDNHARIQAALAGECGRKDSISEIVKRDLTRLNIQIIGEDLGSSGSYRGREVHLDCRQGEFIVYRIPVQY